MYIAKYCALALLLLDVLESAVREKLWLAKGPKLASTIFTTMAHLGLISELRRYTSAVRGSVEASLLYVSYVIIISLIEISKRLVATYDVGALHATLIHLCSTNTEFHAFFPNDLSKMSSSSLRSVTSKLVTRIADFIVPVKKI